MKKQDMINQLQGMIASEARCGNSLLAMGSNYSSSIKQSMQTLDRLTLKLKVIKAWPVYSRYSGTPLEEYEF